MKKLTTLSALALTIPALFAQDAKPLADTKTTDEVILAPEASKKADTSNVPESYKKAINDFSNLPEAKRIAFLKKRQEAGILFQNKRIIETLEATNDLKLIFEGDPQIMNLRGACYVELRDFDKATAEFEASMAITGPSLNVMFNIGEVAFVAENWKEALDTFTKARELAPDEADDMVNIIDLKLMLTHIALAKDSSLSEEDKKAHSAKVAEYSKLHSFLDDTPYFYYATAALHFSKGDKNKGKSFLDKGRRVYASNPAALASWEDTMTEYGYIQSYYGDKKANEEDGE